MPTRSTPSPDGDRLIAGRYRLHQLLGRGAMGTVWAAYDEFLHRQVAVKEVLLPVGIPSAEADELRERTMREARANAVLSHPNVVTLFDVARHDGEPFVVMELVPSNSLAEVLLRHGSLARQEAALVADSLAAALEAAHRAGITHRDVKPGNVLVGRDGQIKLTDFGIARNVAETTLTATGLMLGTPSYIAPEVASGGAVTPAADLWALGATLFAAVEGQPPYSSGADPVATVFEVVHGAVPQPTCGGPLAPLISGLMVKDAALRLPLAEVRRRLQPLLPDSTAGVSALLDAEDEHAEDEYAEEEYAEDGESDEEQACARPVQHDQPPTRPEEPGHTEEVPRVEDDAADSDTVIIRRPAPTAVPHTPLASDPGPLPFTAPQQAPPRTRSAAFRAPPQDRTSAHRPRRGRRLTTLLLATVLFLSAAAGGFAITRTLAGETALPSSGRDADGTRGPGTPEPRYERRTDTATGGDDSAGSTAGRYTVDVPADWLTFYEHRDGELGASVLHRYLSPDGSRMISVQRFVGLYPDADVAGYLAYLGNTSTSSTGEVLMQSDTTLGTHQDGDEPDRAISYRMVDRGLTSNAHQGELRRSTFASLRPRNEDLWVLSVTVPTDTEGAGSRIFEHVSDGFILR
ncbi:MULTISPECIES: serine/threonine-protein kinase [Actinoalloteichus]|uniref:non-specific serine/threonine protein kinase n=1 Tax=Actinoalloteichus fjordicus TaxID=1612552 RepID=A0AAC9LID7_9PSEU|nr:MULTISPECIES: serine/threonine-protein kinase [Actinoalloteichus]APU17445.1 protein kinase family protein [Actinoalloteichus fjordicus]APU23531.1 protein kinase family protein [Actinoalloteichus sp. GBA129-24]